MDLKKTRIIQSSEKAFDLILKQDSDAVKKQTDSLIAQLDLIYEPVDACKIAQKFLEDIHTNQQVQLMNHMFQ